MQVVPLSPKRVKLPEIKNFKSNWQHVQSKVNNKREETIVNDQRPETLKEVKKEHNYKTHSIVTNKSTVVVQKEKKSKKLSWNRSLIKLICSAQSLLQEGVPKNGLTVQTT